MTKPISTAPPKYFNIVTSEAEGAREATIFLYGYIGPEYEFNYNTWDYEQVGITDIDFVTELNRLAESYPVIHLRINSYGGEVYHGSAIVTAITNCKAEVHGWCDGMAASMAASIFLACPQRHMARNAMLMLHPAMNIVWGNADDMRRESDILDKFTAALISGISAGTGMDPEKLKADYFSDYRDHWLNYDDAVAAGLVPDSAMEPKYDSATPPEPAVVNMPYRKMVAMYAAQLQKKEPNTTTNSTDPGGTLLTRIEKMFHSAVAAITGTGSNQPSPDMNLEEFKTSLADGTLDPEAVRAHLAAQAPAPTPETDQQPDPVAELRAQVTAQADEIKNLKASIDTIGAEPGAGKSQPGMPEADTPDPGGPVNDGKKLLAATNDAFVAAAKGGYNPFRKG